MKSWFAGFAVALLALGACNPKTGNACVAEGAQCPSGTAPVTSVQEMQAMYPTCNADAGTPICCTSPN